MEQKKSISALVSGGEASAGPPLGPALGPMGINVLQVVNSINEKTKEFHVRVVNAEKSMISGNRYKTIEIYKEFLEISSATNPIHGPFHPRKPDRILTRMVRGMLPKRKSSGITALKRLRVYIAVPPELKNTKLETFEDSKIRKPSSYFISLGELAKQIGWNGLDSYE